MVSKRYASPFLLLDEYIANAELNGFIDELLKINNEEEIYKLWLHKVYDKSFKDFKAQVLNSNKVVNDNNFNVNETLKDSRNILNNFKPVERG